MGKKKRKDLIEENENLTNTDVGFGEMAIQQTITSWSDIAYNTAAIGAKLDRDPDDSKEETDHGRVHTLEAEVNEVNNRFGTLDATQNNRFDALEAKMDRLSALEVKMDYFMLQFSGQQNTAAAGGFGQGVQFSGQQRTATPAAGGLGQEVQFSGQQRTATPFDRLKREWEDRKALLERQRLRREEQERLERLKEKAAVIIQAFLRTTAVRVKIDRAEHLWGRKNVDAKMYVPGNGTPPLHWEQRFANELAGT